MISDAMNRNIPSTRASTRELMFGAGGPWCLVGLGVRAHAIAPIGSRLHLDVLDGQPGRVPDPA